MESFRNKIKVVGMRNYGGDPSVLPDPEVVKRAVTVFEASVEKTAGYALDFGVLSDSGKTALVEWNDGFALGSYGLDHETYTKLLLERWHELLEPDV